MSTGEHREGVQEDTGKEYRGTQGRSTGGHREGVQGDTGKEYRGHREGVQGDTGKEYRGTQGRSTGGRREGVQEDTEKDEKFVQVWLMKQDTHTQTRDGTTDDRVINQLVRGRYK
jgi:hypothetical protein